MVKLREKLLKAVPKRVVWIVAALIYAAMVITDSPAIPFIIAMIVWMLISILIHRPESFRTVPRDHMADAIAETDAIIDKTETKLSPVERLEMIQKCYDKKIEGLK